MANASHIRLVKRGGEAIEDWRKRGHKRTILDLEGADLARVDLTAADLSHADLTSAHLPGATLDYAQLCDARLCNADLVGVSFDGANLQWAKLVGAMLAGADFSSADLSYADLRNSTLDNADFTNTALKETDLSGAEMAVARFWASRFDTTLFHDATFANTVIYECDLRHVQGLETVSHRGPSLIGVETLFKSGGQIPDVFLRGCGIPENLIAYLHSLTGRALDFYSSFISYTEADDALSKLLYDDLQATGVRCWRWREDAKWGRTLMREVDEGIRLYDKLVVILSDQSLQAEPVIREIERALQKEARGKKDVLFPVRVDDAVFSWKHELQADVVRKVIGDFREWQKQTSYQESLRRLIQGLEAK